MRDERVDVRELFLLADIGVERDLDLPLVQVAIEAEQMRLEQLARRIKRGPDAEACDARVLGSVVQRHPHRIDAVFGPLVVAELEVRGGVAEVPPARVAALDYAFDRIVAG